MAALKRVVFRVLPLPKGGWEVRRDKRQWLTAYRKKMAVFDARALARDVWKDGGLAQLVVHRKDGTLEYESTYGKDPRKYAG